MVSVNEEKIKGWRFCKRADKCTERSRQRETIGKESSKIIQEV